MTTGQVELPLDLDVCDQVTWAVQVHTHPAQMVLKRCGKPSVHTAHPYIDADRNFGCDGKPPESRRCPRWTCPEPHVWAISTGGIYDCAGDPP